METGRRRKVDGVLAGSTDSSLVAAQEGVEHQQKGVRRCRPDIRKAAEALEVVG